MPYRTVCLFACRRRLVDMSTSGDPHSDSIAAATKALAHATSRLAKAMATQASGIVAPGIQTGVTESLRLASETLNRAAERTAATTPAKSKASRTREELLVAAAQVFAEEGIERASMGDIAAKAGYTKGALYANFVSKQDLVRAVVHEMARTASRSADASTDPAEDTPCAALLPGIANGVIDEAALAEWLQEAQEDKRILLSLELMAYGIRYPELREEFAQTSLTGHGSLVTQIHEFRTLRSGTPRTIAAPADSPDERDLDTATAILSVANYTALLNRLTENEAFAPVATARIITRILESNDRAK